MGLGTMILPINSLFLPLKYYYIPRLLSFDCSSKKKNMEAYKKINDKNDINILLSRYFQHCLQIIKKGEKNSSGRKCCKNGQKSRSGNMNDNITRFTRSNQF
jgi:hypothetical protein